MSSVSPCLRGVRRRARRNAQALPEGDSGHRARAEAALAAAIVWTGAADRRRTLSDSSVAMARRMGDPKVLIAVLGDRFAGAASTDNAEWLDQFMDELDEMIELATGTSDTLVCHGHLLRAPGHVIVGDIDAAEADLDDAAKLAEELREPIFDWRLRVQRAGLGLLSGRLEEAERLILEALEQGLASGLEGASDAAGAQLYRLRYEQGRLDELEETLIDLVKSQPAIPAWRMALTGVYTQTDRPEEARPHLEFLAADDFAGVPNDGLWVVTLAGGARTAAQAGLLDIAERAYELGLPYAGRLAWTGVSYEQPIDLSIGTAAAALGRFEDAERHFGDALELSERASAPTFVAATRMQWAEMLLDQGAGGDTARARNLATQARDTAAELGLGRVEQLADRVLGDA